MFHLYFILNDCNDKVYVGLTGLTPEQRFKHHLESFSKKDTLFYRAIKKHGKNSFHVHSIGEFSSREEVNNAEKVWILLLGSYDPDFGYNSTYGGESSFIPTKEVREKKRLAVLGEKNSFFGKKHTEESKSKTSASMMGNPRSPETRAKIGMAFKAKKQSTELIDKRRLAIIAFWDNQREQREREAIFA